MYFIFQAGFSIVWISVGIPLKKLSTTTSFEIVSSDSSRHSFMIALVLGLKIEYLGVLDISWQGRNRLDRQGIHTRYTQPS